MHLPSGRWRSPLALDLFFIVAGSFLEAFSYTLFIAPYKIVPGGVYGVTIVINHLTRGLWTVFPEGLPMGMMALCFNIPFMLLAARFIGLKSGWRTVATFLLIAFFTDMISAFSLGRPLVEDEAVLSCFYGGALLGLGVALVFRAGGTSAGTDVLARILSLRTGVKVSTWIIVLDSCVVLLGLLAFRDWAVPLFSWFTIFLYGRVVQMLQTENPNRAVLIFSRHTEEMSDLILHKMHLGGTFLHGRGMFTGKEREVILTIVDRKDLARLKHEVEKIDPEVFISTMQATKETMYKS